MHHPSLGFISCVIPANSPTSASGRADRRTDCDDEDRTSYSEDSLVMLETRY